MPIAPTLETERLILRPLRPQDAAAHNKHFNDYGVTRYLASRLPWPYPKDGSEMFLKSALKDDNPSYYWAITLKENPDELIGSIELRPNKEHAHRGFWIGTAHHNKGLMTEACFVTNDFWFDVLNKDVLVIENAKGNPASHRIKQKTGATLIATFPNPGGYVDPDLSETEQWILTRTAWKNFKNDL